MVSPAEPTIEFMFLADRAEAINGKLYVMGGCWDRVEVAGLPMTYPLAIALRVVVATDDPLEEHVLNLDITGPGEARLATRGIRFTRQSAPVPGGSQGIVIGAPTVAFLTESGHFEIGASVDGGRRATTGFDVVLTTA